jgi:hypothetical protein
MKTRKGFKKITGIMKYKVFSKFNPSCQKNLDFFQ